MGIPSSVTRFGKHEPFELQMARDQIFDHKSIYKFGFNSDVNGSEETIWDGGGIYAYPSVATVMKVSSSSANDTSAGTGARTVTVAGLDSDYNEAEETVSLNGQTEVLTTTSFIRVNRAFVETAGSGGTAAGDIYVGTGTVTTGVPATVYAKITLGQNQTLMAVWTVPAGYTAYMLRANLSTSTANVNQYVTARVVQRPFGGVFRTQVRTTLQRGDEEFRFPVPLSFPEKTDIETRAVSLGSNNLVASDFTVVYIKNESN